MENDVKTQEQTPTAARQIPKVKAYIIAIFYVVLAAIVVTAYICGISKKHDDAYIEKTFNEKKSLLQRADRRGNIICRLHRANRNAEYGNCRYSGANRHHYRL